MRDRKTQDSHRRAVGIARVRVGARPRIMVPKLRQVRDQIIPSAIIALRMISRCRAIAASFASQRKNVLFAGIDLSAQIERSDSPREMRSQILSWIARVRIEGRPGRRFVGCIAVVIIAAARCSDKPIAQRFARAPARRQRLRSNARCRNWRCEPSNLSTDIHQRPRMLNRCFLAPDDRLCLLRHRDAGQTPNRRIRT